MKLHFFIPEPLNDFQHLMLVLFQDHCLVFDRFKFLLLILGDIIFDEVAQNVKLILNFLILVVHLLKFCILDNHLILLYLVTDKHRVSFTTRGS